MPDDDRDQNSKSDSDAIVARFRRRYARFKREWGEILEAATKDHKMEAGDQWDEGAKTSRENRGAPIITDNRIRTEVKQITNRARQDRPQPKVSPSDDEATVESAAMWEEHMRHIQYASQADVARDYAIESSTIGGFGFYRITTVVVDKKTGAQEPRIKRIRDQFSVAVDPDFEEPDSSDKKWAIIRRKYTWDDFRDKFGEDIAPADFEGDEGNGLKEWGDKEHVWVAEAWEVDNPEDDPEDWTVTQYIMDGIKVRETNKWLGRWIPILMVLGDERVIEGKLQLIGAVRNAAGPQRLLNAYETGIAEAIASSARSTYTGPIGTFKGDAWKDTNQNSYAYREWTPTYSKNGELLPPPQRDQGEPPIQALSQGAMQQIDSIKASFGYIDNITRPSQSDLSGVAIARRSNQQDLINYHFEDNLSRTIWFESCILLDLFQKLYDTTRTIRTRKVTGETGKAMLVPDGKPMPALPATPGEVPSIHFVGKGIYDVTVEVGKSYNTLKDEESDVLIAAMQADPQLWMTYADVLFKIKGYPDLEQRAKLMLPPPIQQAIQSKEQGIPPQAQAAITALNQRVQMLTQGLQQAMQVIQQKQVEAKSKLDVQKLKTMGDVMVEDQKHRHEAAGQLVDEHMRAIENITALLHESELGATPGPGWGNNAQPPLPGAQPEQAGTPGPQGAV